MWTNTNSTNRRIETKNIMNVRNRIWKSRYVYIMVLITTVYFLIFRYWPMAWLTIAFYDYKFLAGFSGSEFVGLKHFKDFIMGIKFWPVIKNTFAINFYSLIFTFPIPIIFAILLNEVTNKQYKKMVQTVSYLPHFISTVVIVSMVVNILSPSTGLINNIIKAVGLQPIYFMGDPKYFRMVYIASGVWQNTGWSAIIYLASITSINTELYEAACVDGAGRFRQIWHVTIPGIRNTIIIMLIMRIGRLMGISFEKVFLMQNDATLSVSEVISTYVYKIGMVRGSYSAATAIGLFNSIISLILVYTANKLAKKYSEVSLF